MRGGKYHVHIYHVIALVIQSDFFRKSRCYENSLAHSQNSSRFDYWCVFSIGQLSRAKSIHELKRIFVLHNAVPI